MKHSSHANTLIKRLLSMGFAAMLLFTIAIVVMPAATVAVPAQAIWIDPTYPDPSVAALNISDTFTVDVKVNVTSPTSPGGTGMFGFEYKLYWNSTYVNVTSYVTHIPSGWGAPNGFLVADDWTVPGRHWYAYSSLTGSPFTGVMSLCTYNFTVINQPISPDPPFNGTLNLQDVKIVDDADPDFPAKFICNVPGEEAGTIQDGMYEVASKVLSAPMLEVGPSPVPGVFGQNFTVNIRIEGLDAAFNLSSWEAKLGYNTTMLDALASAEGPFLQGFAGINGTYYNSTINDTLGIVDMEGGFNGSYTEPSGNGVLATVTFNASWQYTVPPGIPPVTSALNLYNITLFDGEGQPILHDITDGTYKAPYKDDSPPTIRTPARVPAGDVLPDQIVKVLVNITDVGSGIWVVKLSYTTNNGTSWTQETMAYNLTSQLYEYRIPKQDAGTLVKFKITAQDNAGNSATRDGEDVNFVYEVVPEFPAALTMPLFLVATLVAVILAKMVWSRKRRSSFVAK